MKLSTRMKISAAKVLGSILRLYFILIGKRGNLIRCRRKEVNWEIDISEAIDLSIFLFGCFEADTVQALQKLIQPGDICIDIGANIGAHTLLMSKCVGENGRVIAFEPTTWAFEKLKNNISLNKELAGSITTIHGFLSDGSTKLPKQICSSWEINADDSEQIHHKHGGIEKSTDGAICTTLDESVEMQKLQRVDLIKLDVDGYEVPVLRGA